MITSADDAGDHGAADALAVARGFLFREGAEVLGVHRVGDAHSDEHGVVFEGQVAVVTLASRKNSRVPVLLRRTCVCTTR